MYQPSMYHGTSELVSLLLVYVCSVLDVTPSLYIQFGQFSVFKVHILCGVLLGPYVSGREGGRDWEGGREGLGGREGGREGGEGRGGEGRGGEGRGGEGRLFSLQNWL